MHEKLLVQRHTAICIYNFMRQKNFISFFSHHKGMKLNIKKKIRESFYFDTHACMKEFILCIFLLYLKNFLNVIEIKINKFVCLFRVVSYIWHFIKNKFSIKCKSISPDLCTYAENIKHPEQKIFIYWLYLFWMPINDEKALLQFCCGF